MWNSPFTFSENGKRYDLEDLAALVLPLDELLDLTRTDPVADHVSETILQRLEREELVYALYELFEALTTDVPIPEGGHPGVQEALIAELLTQSFGRVVAEIECNAMDSGGFDSWEGDFYIREFVWKSVERFVVHNEFGEASLPWVLEDTGLKLSDKELYRSDKITIKHWDQLLGEECLFDEFLRDRDWRMEELLDLHPDKAKAMTELIGLNLGVVHSLARTPNEEELEMAERYLMDLVRKSEGRDDVRELKPPDPGDSDIPF